MANQYLSKSDILDATDLKYGEVDVSEWWGGVVRIRELSGAEAMEFGMEVMGADGEPDMTKLTPEMMVRVVAAGIVNEKDDQLFTKADVEALGKKGLEPLQLIMKEVLKLSNMVNEEDGAGPGKAVD